jgi:hypothetical protein
LLKSVILVEVCDPNPEALGLLGSRRKKNLMVAMPPGSKNILPVIHIKRQPNKNT